MGRSKPFDIAIIGLGGAGSAALGALRDEDLQVAAIDLDPRQIRACEERLSESLEGHSRVKVTFFEGRARLSGVGAVEVRKGEKTEELRAKAVVLTVGSVNWQKPYVEGHERVLRTEGRWRKFPEAKDVTVIGCGVDALQEVWNFVGKAEVTLIPGGPYLAADADIEVGEEVARWLESCGVRIIKGHEVKAIEPRNDGVRVILDGPDMEVVFSEYVVLADRRFPNIEGLGLEGLPIEYDRDGFIVVDDRCRTRVTWLFAAGEVTGWPFTAEKIFEEGEVAGLAAAGFPSALSALTYPSTFRVGMTLAFAGLRYLDLVRNRTSFSVGTFEGPYGMSPKEYVRVFADPKGDVMFGVSAFGAFADTIAEEAADYINSRAAASEIASERRSVEGYPLPLGTACFRALHPRERRVWP